MKNYICTISLIIITFCITAFAFKKENIQLPKYSVSLAVKDVKASYEFYSKMGFEPMNGTETLKQNWIIMTNGVSKIGLFQGMFPKNTITLNPENNREIFKQLKTNGLQPIGIINMDKETGPCTFTITDPDGNPILFDQH